MKGGGTLLSVSFGLCVVLWVEKVSIGESTIGGKASHLDLLVAIRTREERRALVRDLDVRITELTDGKSSSVNGLDMFDESAVGDVDGATRVDQSSKGN